jgi:hypothetical protein
MKSHTISEKRDFKKHDDANSNKTLLTTSPAFDILHPTSKLFEVVKLYFYNTR